MTDLDFSAMAEPAGALDFSAHAEPITALGPTETGARALAGSGSVLLDALNGLGGLADPSSMILRAMGTPDEIAGLADRARDYARIQPNEIPENGLALSARDVGGLPGGALEAVGNLGSMMAALPAAGVAGLGTAAGNALGLTNAEPGDVVNDIASAMTYQPKTPTGQTIAGAVSLPFELLAKGGRKAGEFVQDETGSPIAATAVDTAIQALPMLLGARGKVGAELPRDAVTPEDVAAYMREHPPAPELPPGNPAEAPRAARAADDITDAEFTDLARLMAPDRVAPAIAVDRLGTARSSADYMTELLDAMRRRDELGITPGTDRAIDAHDLRTARDADLADQRADDAPPWWLAGQMAELDHAAPRSTPTDLLSSGDRAAAPTTSWIIREKDTRRPVMETFDERAIQNLNTDRYEAVPAKRHLAEFNETIKRGEEPPKFLGSEERAATAHDRDSALIQESPPSAALEQPQPHLPTREALARAEKPLESEAMPDVAEITDADLTPAERAAFERQSSPRELSTTDLTPAERASFERQSAVPAERGAERELTAQMVDDSRTQGATDADRNGLRAAVDEVLAGAEGAPKVEFVRDEDGLPEGTRLQSHGGRKVRREGLYDPDTQQVHILTENVTTPERAAWVAAHEIAGHHGLRGLIGERAFADGRKARDVLDAALDTARQNPTVAKLADAIGAQRKSGNPRLMAEEAIAELAAATRTGNWDHLRDRYGVDVPEGVREGAKTAVRRFVERIKALLAKLFKKARFSDVDVHQLVEDAWQYVRKPRERATAETARETARESVAEPRDESLESVAADSGDIPQPERERETPSRRPGESQRDYARRVMRTSKEAIAEATKIAKHQQKVGRANFREMLAKQARAMDVADAAFHEARVMFDKTPENINLATIDQWENGQPIGDRDAAQFFSDMKAAFDQRVDRIRELDPSALQSLIENYFPHIWEDSAKAAKWYQGFVAKRPLEGNRSFLKQRTWGTIKEGMASGLKPVSTNPVDLALLKLSQMDKFIAFHEFRDDLKSRGWLKEMPAGARVPEGYARVDDPAFAKAGGLAGYYAVPELIARDINNYLAPSLYRFGAWKSLRAVQNTLMSARLGMSMFHAGFTTLDNLVQHVGVGLQRFADGDIAGGLRMILRDAPLSFIEAPLEGGRLIDEWRGKRESDPHTAALLNLIEQGGGRWKMSSTEYNQSLPKIIRAVRQRQLKGETVGHAFSAVGEASSWIIHHWLVPRQKMAARVMLLKFELDHFAAALGKKRGDYAGIIDAMHPDVAKQLAGKVVDAVDNRLGQMTYDNQFWNKTVREVAQALIGAVGWQVGTVRTVTSGLHDVYKIMKSDELVATLDKAGKITDQKMSRVGGNLLNLISLALIVGGGGAILQKLLTGKDPEGRDFFFPRTGRRNPDDSEERLQLPTYWMDHYKLATHPLTTASHKIHPSISMLMDLFKNQDYFGTQIRSPDDNLMEQAKDIAEYVALGFVPYSINNQTQLAETDSGAGERLGNFFGVTRAPASVSRSPFQTFVAEKAYNAAPKGARTQEATDRSHMMHGVEDKLRDLIDSRDDWGSIDGDARFSLARKIPEFAALSEQDQRKALKAANMRVPEIRFLRLGIEDKLRAWGMADADERKRYNLRAIILRSDLSRSSVFQRMPEDEKKTIRARIKEIAGAAAVIGDKEDQ